VGVSDCWTDRRQAAKEFIDTHYRNQDCRAYPDFRELLGQNDLDAVLLAIGNRWHGLGSIYAARAGKDVYSEKPVTLTIAEGRALVDTCRRFGTIYQAGTQRRATESYAFARAAVRRGRIGQLRTIEMQVWTGPGIPHDAAAAVPEGLDYDLWLGQSPWKPYVPAHLKAWQYYWDTAEGILTDMGCHYTDQMQWVLESDHTGPVEFEATGELPDPARYGSDTPITATARCRYADGVEGVIHQRAGFNDRYIRYVGEEGWIQVNDATDQVTASTPALLNERQSAGTSWANASAHIHDFTRSIRSRRPTRCHPEAAHRAATICQAWNISLRLGQKLKWDPATERFDLTAANRMLVRQPRAPWRY
jgi:predicted dehydrogenase